MRDIQLTQEYTTSVDDSKMRALVQTMLTHEARGSDRDALYVEIEGWDHHAELKPRLSERFQTLNNVLTLFEQEMKAQGLWDQVTMVITSDFGRTLTPNSGGGSDHA